MDTSGHSGGSLRAAMIASLALLVLAVVVRGFQPAPQTLPEDQPGDEERIREPMQFLSRGAALRVRELDAWVSKDLSVSWRAQRGRLFALDDCPSLMVWLDGEEGQRLERLLARLRAGSREDALGALAMIFQLARATEWDTGLLGGSHHAERLARLLQDWLRNWAERSAEDAVLHEPALAAALLYGRAMRIAYEAPVVGRNRPAYERARNFLQDLCGTGTRQRSAFGESLRTSHPRALSVLESDDDFLRGFRGECIVLFPGLDGDCDG